MEYIRKAPGIPAQEVPKEPGKRAQLHQITKGQVVPTKKEEKQKSLQKDS